MRPSEFKWVLVKTREIRIQVNPSESMWIQMSRCEFSKSKWIQVRPGESKWIQVKPCECRWVQLNSSESKWIQLRPGASTVRPSESPLPPILLSNFSWLYRYNIRLVMHGFSCVALLCTVLAVSRVEALYIVVICCLSLFLLIRVEFCFTYPLLRKQSLP